MNRSRAVDVANQKTPEMNRSRWVEADATTCFFRFRTPNSRGFRNFQNPTFPPDFQKSHFFCKEKLFLVPPQSLPPFQKTPEMNSSRRVDVARYFYFFLTPSSREDIDFSNFQNLPKKRSCFLFLGGFGNFSLRHQQNQWALNFIMERSTFGSFKIKRPNYQ